MERTDGAQYSARQEQWSGKDRGPSCSSTSCNVDDPDARIARLSSLLPQAAPLTHEEVVRLRTPPPNLKQLQQVPKLSVYIPAYGHWRIHVLYIGLLYEDLARLEAEGAHL